ncbi:hypothetical protein GTW25_19305 [Aliihoeflea aestuarii]|jgi:hypothetical protein|uniref:hypothetical protein n=1 Tax=Aliihoeflea aestuarii TaxID=453840 RepID=UPI002094AEAF|nr:hypothetical protein [Aliihoeflea aestuarii]MCO6393171.1 hypothetical protein [Aliihoeflea aestuarii]
MFDHFYPRPRPLPPDPAADFFGGLAAFLVVAVFALAVSAAGGSMGSVERAPYISLAEQASSCEALFDPKILSAPDGVRPDCRARL